MSYAKFAFAAVGFSLLASTALADGLKTGNDSRLASVGASGEIPLGLLIKTPGMPHGASLNHQVASAFTRAST